MNGNNGNDTSSMEQLEEDLDSALGGDDEEEDTDPGDDDTEEDDK
jgi:hypothetical protein